MQPISTGKRQRSCLSQQCSSEYIECLSPQTQSCCSSQMQVSWCASKKLRHDKCVTPTTPSSGLTVWLAPATPLAPSLSADFYAQSPGTWYQEPICSPCQHDSEAMEISNVHDASVERGLQRTYSAPELAAHIPVVNVMQVAVACHKSYQGHWLS